MNWKRIRQIVFYAFASLVLFVAFLYWRFPSDLFREIIAARVADLSPGTSVTVERVKPGFPPGLRLEKALLWFDDRMEAHFRVETTELRPDLGKLFSGLIQVDGDLRAYGGMGQGTFKQEGLPGRKGPIHVNLKFDHLALQEIAYLRHTLGRTVTGKLKGTLTYNRSGKAPGAGRLDFRVANGVYPLLENTFGLDRIDFREIYGQLAWNEKTLKVERIYLTGEKARIVLKGEIALNAEDFNASGLNLTASVELPSMNNAKGILTITGTVFAPVVAFKMG